MNITNIPAPRTELIDQRTGLISREWYRFFVNLFTLTGGGQSSATIEDVQLSMNADAVAARYDVLMSAISELQLTQQAAANDDLEAKLRAVETDNACIAIDLLSERVQALEMYPPVVPIEALAGIDLDGVKITNSEIDSSTIGATIASTGVFTTLEGATSVKGASYLAADNSPGITTSITTATLVGKTVTIKNGLITAFA